jgi:hypothetical protein
LLVIAICFLYLPASFTSGNVAAASFPINKINKGRWTEEEYKIFMQEYEKKHQLKLKSMLNVASNKI